MLSLLLFNSIRNFVDLADVYFLLFSVIKCSIHTKLYEWLKEEWDEESCFYHSDNKGIFPDAWEAPTWLPL